MLNNMSSIQAIVGGYGLNERIKIMQILLSMKRFTIHKH